MPDKTIELAGVLTETINNTVKSKTKEYDTSATVTRIDETGQVWVKIPGGVVETPVKKTFSVKPGDEVQVHVGAGRAFLQGNYSAPPTDDTRADEAYGLAADAIDSAVIARKAADSAVESAEVAAAAASEAKATTDEINRYAETAGKTVTQILNDGETAGAAAIAAQGAADNALKGLSTVESVVNVVNWVTKPENVTTDTTVDPTKTYYIYDPNTGTISVADPQTGDNPSALGWYEIDEAIAKYINNHLALTDDGLTIISDNNSTRTVITNGQYEAVQSPVVADISTYYEIVNGQYVKTSDTTIAQGKTYYAAAQKPGMYIWNANQQIAYYGDGAMIGTRDGFNIRISGSQLGFYDGKSGDPDTPVAYLSRNTLYITRSVVVDEMKVGVRNGGTEWTWKYDQRDRSLYLKWIGA